MPPCGSWQCVQREYRRPHSPAPHSSTPSVFSSNIPLPIAFIGWSAFCAPCRFPCFPVAVGLAQRKPPSDSVSMEHSWGKSPQKLLLCILVEACQVGDYRSYYRLMHSAPAPAHTPAQPDHRRQPMRWTPLRTIAEVTPVLYTAPVAAPSLAEYSKGSSTLCDGDPFG